MNDERVLGELFERYVEEHVVRGRRLAAEDLCRERPDLLAALRGRIESYEALDGMLDSGTTRERAPATGGGALPGGDDGAALPSFPGFRTLERLGRGGQGDVFKLEDLKLGRMVAGKVLRAGGPARARVEDFLREAKTLALFSDPRIVQVHELRTDGPAPLLVMELVDGFPLTEVAPSLEHAQRARIVAEACEAVHRAHALGLTHRDLKPANILLDKRLQPKILDFGLASDDPTRGHGVGTLHYLAPEQAEPGRPIDARTDVHALGVVLYELLCGQLPYRGATQAEVLAAIERGQPRLPVEIDAAVPEPLQAVALKAMETDPEARYATAGEMARDLRRFLEGRPVLARPRIYATALAARVEPHLAQVADWLRLKLIHPHEAERLRAAYAPLGQREDDWIVQSRSLSLSQVALYLGAFVLALGAVLYFGAERLWGGPGGLVGPLLALALPFVALDLAARVLRRGDARAVAVAFQVAGVALLPLMLLLLFAQAGLWIPPENASSQLLGEAAVSNRQLQVALLVTCAWAAWLALGTRTIALSSLATLAAFLACLALLGDLGLREWVENLQADRIALHVLPVVVLFGGCGLLAERARLPSFATPLHVAAAILLVVTLEMLSLEGKLFERLGLSLGGSDPDVFLDTLAAMTLCGLVFHAAGWLIERRGTPLQRPASQLLLLVAPFAVLEPIAWLNASEDYSVAYLWLYLALAIATTCVSHWRQRKGFYYAGISNTGLAILLVTDRFDWFDVPAWPITLMAAGIAVLLAGWLLHARERSRRGH